MKRVQQGAGAFFLARKTGRFLLVLRSMYCPKPHTWAGVGGIVEDDESPEEGARREIAEEIGFDDDCEFIKLFVSDSSDFRYTNYLAIVDDEFEPLLNWENDEAKWFSIDEFPEDIHPGFASCLQDDNTKNVLEKELASIGKGTLTEAVLPDPHPGFVDPALLTSNEFLDIINRDRKGHRDSAYKTTVAKLSEYRRVTDFPKLVQRVRKNGLDFEIRLESRKNQYGKRTPDNEWLRDDSGQFVLYTDEEIERLGKPKETYTLAVFNSEKQCVASFTPDEWGCSLIQVADEYSQMGFGALLTKMGYTMYPNHPTGGMTSGGNAMFRKVHQSFVSDALKDGTYRRMINNGEITIERIREITQSVGLPSKPDTRQETNLQSNNPADWLLFRDDYGTFILYDKKLKELFGNPRWEHFLDTMVKGMVYVNAGETYGVIFAYGGETQKIRTFMLRLAASYCERNGATLLVDKEDIADATSEFFDVEDETVGSGAWRSVAELKGEPIDYESITRPEEEFRKTFDRYDEFKSQMMEFAHAKYQHPGD